MSRIGIIGGSGLYNIEGLQNLERVKLNTPFGNPSDEFILGNLESPCCHSWFSAIFVVNRRFTGLVCVHPWTLGLILPV